MNNYKQICLKVNRKRKNIQKIRILMRPVKGGRSCIARGQSRNRFAPQNIGGMRTERIGGFAASLAIPANPPAIANGGSHTKPFAIAGTPVV